MPDPVPPTPPAAPPAAPPPGAPPAVPPAPATWYANLDAETIGHLQTKGWHEKDAATAASEAVKAYREAERYIGAPADRIVKLPATADAPEWADVWSRLGKPTEAKDYDLSAVKFADGTEVSDSFADFARATAHTLNLPKEAGTRLAAEMAKFLDGAAGESAAANTAKLVSDKAELAKEWGANQEAQLFIAKQAAQKLGVDPAAVSALENAVGYAAVMKMFNKIGHAIGEDKFVSGGVGPNGLLTLEQAVSQKGELMRDNAWTQRYLAGGQAETNQMTALNTIIANAAI